MLYDYELRVFNHPMAMHPQEIKTGTIELMVCPREREYVQTDGLEARVKKVVHSTAGVKLILEFVPGQEE